ncbi:hypothetical protein CW731_12740 [Polaribacter sp. ALD11]|uniref:hypothetical protein n=1 Tax=Polaribacter sp. ALD11 TaxID=2058137 RepID=UPI000C312A92|nr:hypothetical protein [Polaribacter sp. ALD11]AUC86095.1 hypothetical protein CW731_12740 [Polaribacter sp. ALD11]
MRKLILTVVVAALTSGASISAANISNNNSNSDEIITVVVNDSFKEIAVKELPKAVSEAILKDFKTATVAKAYVNGSAQYKIELTVDATKTVVYADKEGKWLKEEDIITEK